MIKRKLMLFPIGAMIVASMLTGCNESANTEPTKATTIEATENNTLESVDNTEISVNESEDEAENEDFVVRLLSGVQTIAFKNNISIPCSNAVESSGRTVDFGTGIFGDIIGNSAKTLVKDYKFGDMCPEVEDLNYSFFYNNDNDNRVTVSFEKDANVEILLNNYDMQILDSVIDASGNIWNFYKKDNNCIYAVPYNSVFSNITRDAGYIAKINEYDLDDTAMCEILKSVIEASIICSDFRYPNLSKETEIKVREPRDEYDHPEDETFDLKDGTTIHYGNYEIGCFDADYQGSEVSEDGEALYWNYAITFNTIEQGFDNNAFFVNTYCASTEHFNYWMDENTNTITGETIRQIMRWDDGDILNVDGIDWMIKDKATDEFVYIAKVNDSVIVSYFSGFDAGKYTDTLIYDILASYKVN